MTKLILRSFGVAAVLTAASTLLAGCGAGDSGVSSATESETLGSRALAVVKIDEAREVRFYELPEGGVVITASTDAGAVLAQDEYNLRGTAEEVFSRLRPGASVPEALKAADARQALLTGERVAASGQFERTAPEWRELPAVSSDDSKSELVSKDPSDAWFESWACQTSILQHATTGKSVRACLLNRSGGGSTAVTKVWEGAGSAFSYRGAIVFKVKFKNSSSSTWLEMEPRAFGAGEGGTNWVWNSPAIPQDITFEVSDATGDGYHRAVATGVAPTCRSGCSFNGQVCLCPL